MTQTSKLRPITFPIVEDENGYKFRRNAETGVEIHPQRLYGVKATRYIVTAPTRGVEKFSGTVINSDVIEDELTLASARAYATERVELMREVIAEAYDEAAVWIYDELNAAEMSVARVPSKALQETLAAAFRSLEAGNLPAANARLFRVLGHWRGEPFPLDTEIVERLNAAERDFPEHTLVKAHRDPEGLEWMVWRRPFIDAEAGRVVLSLSTPDARHTRSAYADEVILIPSHI